MVFSSSVGISESSNCKGSTFVIVSGDGLETFSLAVLSVGHDDMLKFNIDESFRKIKVLKRMSVL